MKQRRLANTGGISCKISCVNTDYKEKKNSERDYVNDQLPNRRRTWVGGGCVIRNSPNSSDDVIGH